MIASHLVHAAVEKGSKVVFCVERTVLLRQFAHEHLAKWGVQYGCQGGGEEENRDALVQVVTAQTVGRRGWPACDLLVIDEAHLVYEVVKKKILSGDCVVIGLTATPFTKGLGKLFQGIVNTTTTRKLIDDGFLVPYRIFAPSAPDMTGAKVVAGEWTDHDCEERSIKIVGDVVESYKKYADGRKFIGFGSTVKHCLAMQQQFLKAGILSEMFTYETPDNEKQFLMEQFKREDSPIRGLWSVSALSRGLDVPDVSCIISARPLRKSLSEHIQVLGRGLRPHPSKSECIVLDHGGNAVRFYDKTEQFFDEGCHELDDGEKIQQEKVIGDKPEKGRACPKCHHVHPFKPFCPNCGHVYPIPKPEEHEKGELVEFTGKGKAPTCSKQEWYSALLHHAHRKGYKPGWADHQFAKKWNEMPKDLLQIRRYNEETERWVFSREIAYRCAIAKSKKTA